MPRMNWWCRPAPGGVIVHIGHVAADERVEIYLVRFEGADGNLGVPIGCLLEEITQDEALARSLVTA